jgi:hypothetical protein
MYRSPSYSSLIESRRVRLAVRLARIWAMSAYGFLVGDAERKRPLRRPEVYVNVLKPSGNYKYHLLISDATCCIYGFHVVLRINSYYFPKQHLTNSSFLMERDCVFCAVGTESSNSIWDRPSQHRFSWFSSFVRGMLRWFPSSQLLLHASHAAFHM